MSKKIRGKLILRLAVGHVAERHRQAPPYLEAFHQRRAGHRQGKKHFFR